MTDKANESLVIGFMFIIVFIVIGICIYITKEQENRHTIQQHEAGIIKGYKP